MTNPPNPHPHPHHSHSPLNFLSRNQWTICYIITILILAIFTYSMGAR